MTDTAALPPDDIPPDELAADGDDVTFGNPTEVLIDGPDDLLTMLGVAREPVEQAQTVQTDPPAAPETTEGVGTGGYS